MLSIAGPTNFAPLGGPCNLTCRGLRWRVLGIGTALAKRLSFRELAGSPEVVSRGHVACPSRRHAQESGRFIPGGPGRVRFDGGLRANGWHPGRDAGGAPSGSGG